MIGILARDDDVKSILREHLGPIDEALLVKGRSVGGVELFTPGRAGARRTPGMTRVSAELMSSIACLYTPISCRQCLYIARIAASEISVSEVPASSRGIELDQMVLVGHAAHAVLHEFHRLVVLQSEEAGRSHQVALPQAMPGHFLIIAFEAEHGPFHDELVRTVGHDLANAERVHFALHDQVRPDRRHGHRPWAVEFLDEIHEARLPQRHAFLVGAHLLLGVARIVLVSDLADAMTPCRPLLSVSISERLPATRGRT